jgi:hypothetical protein
MKVVAMAVLALAGAAQASVTFNDTVGDVFDGGLTNMDILSVTMSNDATNLYMTLRINANLASTNWGKYLVMIDRNGNASGRTDNPWGRNINTNGRQNDVYIGSWIDQEPDSFAQIWTDTGSNWNLDATVGVDRSMTAIGEIKYTFSLASLGVGLGDTFYFDVMSTGGIGNPPGVDHLSRSTQATGGWNETSVAGDYLAYTVVPTPGTLALLGLGIAAAARRRR